MVYIVARSHAYVDSGVPRISVSSKNGLGFRLMLTSEQGLTKVKSRVTELETEPIVEMICKV